jgi:hypothetical protein
VKPDPAKRDNSDVERAASLTLDALARQQGVGAVRSADELRADIWESDEELEAFLVEVRRSRDADLA